MIRNRFKTGIAVMCAVMLSGAVFTGCGSDDSEKSETKEFSTASEFIDAYSVSERMNYNAKGGVNIGFDMTDGNNTVNLGADTSFDIDIADTDMHGSITISGGIANLFGTDADESHTAEFYYSGSDNRCYSKDESEDEWYFTSDNTFTSIAAFADVNFDSEIFANAEFKADEAKNQYIITMPLRDMFKSDALNSLVSESESETFNFGSIFAGEEFTTAAENKFVVYTFDMDTQNLLSVKTDPVEFTGETNADEEDSAAGMIKYTISFSAEINLSDYGKIDSKNAAVSDDIKNSAIDADAEIEDEYNHDDISGDYQIKDGDND